MAIAALPDFIQPFKGGFGQSCSDKMGKHRFRIRVLFTGHYYSFLVASKGASSAAPGFLVVTSKVIFVDENTSLLGSREASGRYEKPAIASGFTLILLILIVIKGLDWLAVGRL